MAIQTFVELANQYDPAIATGVNRVIANAISGNADTITEGLTLYVIIIAGLMAYREMSWGSFIQHALRASVIAFLMTAAGFNQMIAVPAMQTIPAWIAQTSNAATAVTSGAMQFELIWSAFKHQEAAILQQATGLENLGYRIEAAFYTSAAGFLLMIGFWIYEFSRMVMGLIVATLPFVLVLYLFEATRGIPLRVLHKGVGVLILQLLLSIMLQLMLQGDSYILQKAYEAGAGDLDAQIGTLEDLTVFFAFGIGMVIFIPSMASYFGGGIALSVGSSVFAGAARVLTAARAGAGALGRTGSAAIRQARN